MMSPRPGGDPISRKSDPDPFRQTPLQIVHLIGSFLRIWSVFSMYQYVTEEEVSVLVFIFSCLVPSSVIFLASQKPWRGRSLSNSQVVPSIINGGIMALYFILWGKGLKTCGPIRVLLAEYAGAVLGVLSALLHGRRGQLWKKDRSDVSSALNKEKPLKMKEMVIPIVAGILSGLRRVVARRVSLKNQLKRRLHSITVTSAACFIFPFAIWEIVMGSTPQRNWKPWFSSWAYISTVLFGMVLIFYMDSLAEERLHMVVSSPRHLMVSAVCIIIMAIMYQMDFSLIGFLVCSIVLGVGIFEATSMERIRKTTSNSHSLVDDTIGNDQSLSLPS
ncbi:hypothetical protein EJ110_NYTH20166 [Nymphaea thermarum]|nr:hypothetical protein EJ110_NYTH20166 [Nymphaea thermarum]